MASNIAYLSEWQAGRSKGSASAYMIPQGGGAQSQNGGVELLAGAMLDYYVPQDGSASVQLDASTKEFVDGLQKSDTNLHASQSERAEVGAHPALLTGMITRTPCQQNLNQTIYLHTVARHPGLWYAVLASPSSLVGQLDPIFKQIISTVQLPN